jgi:hypothetical protein
MKGIETIFLAHTWVASKSRRLLCPTFKLFGSWKYKSYFLFRFCVKYVQ